MRRLAEDWKLKTENYSINRVQRSGLIIFFVLLSTVFFLNAAAEGATTINTLASGLNISSNIAVDSSAIYWTEDDGTVPYYADATTGLLKKVGLDGGTVTTLASGLNHPDAVLIDTTNVYWIERGSWPHYNGTIKKMPKNGGTITTLASGLNYPQGPSTIDSTNVYFGDPCDILKVGINGGTITTLATTVCWSPAGISVNSSGNLYYTDQTYTASGVFNLYTVGINGGTVTMLAPGFTGGNQTVADGTNVYWTAQGGVPYGSPMAGAGFVYKVPQNGGAVTALASGLNAPSGIALDSITGDLYFAEAGTWINNAYNNNTGTIKKVSINGGTITTLATGLNSSSSVAVDSTSVYWSEGNGPGTGAIKKMPKSASLSVPGAPTGVSAVAGNGQATVSFTAPASNGGSAITSYTVTSSPGGVTATGSASPVTITGLTNGTAYTFTVTATNSVGTGLASSPSNSVMPTANAFADTPITLASGLNDPQYLTQDSVNFYWVDVGTYPSCNGSLYSMPLSGGTITTLASGLCTPYGVASDGTNVFIAEYAASAIKKISVSGGTITTITSTPWPTQIAIDSTNVYWTTNVGIDGTAGSVNKNGGAITYWGPISWNWGAYDIAVDGTNVYWGNPYDGYLRKASLNSMTTTALAPLPNNSGVFIALDSTNVYWTESTTGKINMIPKAGGPITTIASGLNLPQALAVDTTTGYIYFEEVGTYTGNTYNSGTGTLKKVPIGGGVVTTLASGLNAPVEHIDVDSTYVYWAEQGTYTNGVCNANTGAIKKMPLWAGSLGNLVLSVSKTGTGSGKVTANSGTITWNGSTGTAFYSSGTSVTLTATADQGSTFTSWTGCDSTSGNTCTVTMTATKNITATFATVATNGACGSSNGGTFATAPSANLCSAGTASTVSGTGPWTWTCTGLNGGAPTSCSANSASSYTVTPSAGPGGSISPSTPQTVPCNGTTTFIITPIAGYHIDSVSGCEGLLSNGTYTTGAITSNCTVSATFAIDTPANSVSSGNNISVAPATGDNLTFTNVTTGGTATVTQILNPTSPFNFIVVGGTAYDITFNGAFSGSATVCLSYDPSKVQGSESNVRLIHFSGGYWTDITSAGYPDTVNHKVCGVTSSFSPFAVVEPALGTGYCSGGTNAGKTCAGNSDCPGSTCALINTNPIPVTQLPGPGAPLGSGYCVGGTSAGKTCSSNTDCSGGGTCVLTNPTPTPVVGSGTKAGTVTLLMAVAIHDYTATVIAGTSCAPTCNAIINWGDGSSAKITQSGTFFTSHDYTGSGKGNYTITVAENAYDSTTPSSATAGASLTVSVPNTPSIVVTVNQANGTTPLVGALVTVQSTAVTKNGYPMYSYAVKTNSSGVATISAVPGTYTVTPWIASGVPFTQANQTCTINSSASASCTLTFQVQPATTKINTVSGKVMDASSNPLAGATVYLNVSDPTKPDDGKALYAATTAADGTYSVNVVPPCGVAANNCSANTYLGYNVSVVLAGYAFGPGSVANPVTAAGTVTDNFTALPQLAQPTTQCIKNLCQGGLNDGQACTTVADCPAFPL